MLLVLEKWLCITDEEVEANNIEFNVKNWNSQFEVVLQETKFKEFIKKFYEKSKVILG